MASAEVEIDLFSGLPNPTWTLSADRVATLLDLVAALPRSEAGPGSVRLGYRGMIVRLLGTPESELRVFDGVAAMSDTRHADADRRVERWLLETGREFVNPHTYEIVASELTAPQ